jgi:hypothetical protein
VKITEQEFRKVVCGGCNYLSTDDHVGGAGYCNLPITKDCGLEKWELIWKAMDKAWKIDLRAKTTKKQNKTKKKQ